MLRFFSSRVLPRKSLMASSSPAGRTVHTRCRLPAFSRLVWSFPPRGREGARRRKYMRWTRLVSFIARSFVVCLSSCFTLESRAFLLPHPLPSFPGASHPSRVLPCSPPLLPSSSRPASLPYPSPVSSLRPKRPLHSVYDHPSCTGAPPTFSVSLSSSAKRGRHCCLSDQAAREFRAHVLPAGASRSQQPSSWRHGGGVWKGGSSAPQFGFLTSSRGASSSSFSLSPCSLGCSLPPNGRHDISACLHEETPRLRSVSDRCRERGKGGKGPRRSSAVSVRSVFSRLCHFGQRNVLARNSQTFALSRLHADSGKDVARASEQEAPYPSFIVPSPHPPPPARTEESAGQAPPEEEEDGEEEARHRAEKWRVDRTVLQLGGDELERRVEGERKEIQARWRARLAAEEERGQDQLEMEREEQIKLIRSRPSPPWAYVFRELQVDPQPPLRYDFRVYQPYFRSLIAASKPFVKTKVVPPSTLQRLFERQRSQEYWLSSGFRFKQIQPLFAHNAGCSAFYYFHTCFSSLAPSFLNALRRTSVCRMEALAITAVKIEGANHEFYSIAGVREDIVDDIFNNLGRVIFREPRFAFVKESELGSWLAAKGEEFQTKEVKPQRDDKRQKTNGTATTGRSKTRMNNLLLPPGTSLVYRRKKDRQKPIPGWMSVLSGYGEADREKSAASEKQEGEDKRRQAAEHEEEDDQEMSAYYRIPMPPPPPANFTHPLRARLRVKGPLVAVAGHIQLPEGVEILNKNQYLFTVNSGYYVNMDFKIERIMEFVMPEYGYDSLERDRDEEGFMYFTNHVAPIPIFAYAAERRGESVHTKWNAVDENAPAGQEAEQEEEEEELRPEVAAILRAATAGAPPAVAERFSQLFDESEKRKAERTEGHLPLEEESEWSDKVNQQEEGGGEASGSDRGERGNKGGASRKGNGVAEDEQANDVECTSPRSEEAAALSSSSPSDPTTVSQTPRETSSRRGSFASEDRYRFVEPTEQDREKYRREYLENDLPYQNLGEVVTLEVQTDGSITPREGLLRCCDDLIQQALAIQDALYNNCHIGVDGNDEEEFDDPDWYQDAHRYVGVPWNPYKGSAARTQQRQDFFFKPDVLRQYNILREKIDQRREAYAAALRQKTDAAGHSPTEAPDTLHPPVWPLPGRGVSSDYFVSAPGASGISGAEKQKALEQRLAESQARLQSSRERLQQQGMEGLGGQPVVTYGLSDAKLRERLLDEEEEEERIVNTSAIIRKEREDEWRDKQRMFRELAENEPLKRLGDGKGLVRYPPDSKPMMEAPDWVMDDPMGARMPLGFHEFTDD